MWAGGASSKRLPSSIPAGYESQTGYQYDSISRVAGQRDPAPPSNFSKLGGFKNKVFITEAIYNSPSVLLKIAVWINTPAKHLFYSISRYSPSHGFGMRFLLEHFGELPGCL